MLSTEMFYLLSGIGDALIVQMIYDFVGEWLGEKAERYAVKKGERNPTFYKHLAKLGVGGVCLVSLVITLFLLGTFG